MPDDEAPPERTALYRLYDADDTLLYIGIAKDPEKRWAQHARDKHSTWWPTVARKTVTWLASREEADEAETLGIQGERPLHNRAKTVGQRMTFNDTQADRWAQVSTYPMSLQTLDALRAEIETSPAPSGSPFPTIRNLVDRFGVSPQTAAKALRLLAEEGLIHRSRPGTRYLHGPTPQPTPVGSPAP